VPVSGILPPQWAPKHVCVPGVWTNFVRIMVVTKRPQNGVYEAALRAKLGQTTGTETGIETHWGRRKPDTGAEKSPPDCSQVLSRLARPSSVYSPGFASTPCLSGYQKAAWQRYWGRRETALEWGLRG
jgi:hypothetical protein